MHTVHPGNDPIPETERFTLARVEAFVLRWPVAVPVRTSFGTMHDRPAVFVRVESDDGAVGWGETWCNFPSCGAEHRARLIETVLAPLVAGRAFASPAEAYRELTQRTAVLAIQSAEPGPIAQAIAGIDLALWDLAARRAGVPLWRLLGGTDGRIGVYASGINPDDPRAVVAACKAGGYTAFKLKIGFGAERDLANLAAVRDAAGADATVMVDANQAWDLADALALAPRLERYAPAWLEEPLRADRPLDEWRALARATSTPLAGGENLLGGAAFDAALASGAFGVIQPDVAKWGGLSGILPVVAAIHAARRRFCPHYLGAGIGLLASAHLLAARGAADGLLEVDSNDNPLRSALAPALAQIVDGRIDLGDAPGIGIAPDLAALRDACARAAHG